MAANCTYNVFDLCWFKRAVFGLQVKIMHYKDKYFYYKAAQFFVIFYTGSSVCLFFFTEGYNLLLVLSSWNSALL